MSKSPAPALRPDDLVRRGLKFSQLRLMAALRETGQIGAAAQQVGMTQPAASRLLTQLETLIGTALYLRHPRGVVLTEAGRIVADQAQATLRGLDLSQERVTQTMQGARGLVGLGSVTGPSLELVLPMIREMRIAYPEIEISVQVDTSDRLADALLSQQLDFFIGRIPDGADARPFAVEPIGVEPLSLVVRLDHPLTRRSGLRLEDCLGYDWAMQPPGGLLRRTVENYLLARDLMLPARTLSTRSTLFTLALVHESNAIAPLSAAVADFFIGRAALGSRLDRLPVAPDLSVATYGIIRRAGDPLSPAAERILTALRRVVSGRR
ncbi:LysR family transcriptional regulator [Mesobaculum littorinae]|uniref:LysR family transcriptional regulator n=1 Tax=Mesobaculum littorinae TaxID=2486419 RepID=A0A438AMR1_9RHOB|nr:LysR family transcriptional regulator [Mesobaculum littorinae]RVV99949.1 LysR family transcriptional regulator [Mesobaculum littorinae]